MYKLRRRVKSGKGSFACTSKAYDIAFHDNATHRFNHRARPAAGTTISSRHHQPRIQTYYDTNKNYKNDFDSK